MSSPGEVRPKYNVAQATSGHLQRQQAANDCLWHEKDAAVSPFPQPPHFPIPENKQVEGKTRDEVPTAMFLRSGDIILMAGEARERFHGVPRIFIESDQQDISALLSQLSGEDDHFILDYIKNSRININVRQVY